MLKQKLLSLMLDPKTGKLVEQTYKFTVYYRKRLVQETEIRIKTADPYGESLYQKGLNSLNKKLQSQITFGLNTSHLHVHVSMLGLSHYTDFRMDETTLVTWPVPHAFLMNFIASNKIKNLLATTWGSRHESWMKKRYPWENRKFVREVGRLHLWEKPIDLGFVGPDRFRVSLKECVSGSESPAVFQEGEIKSPQFVSFFVILELHKKLLGGISSVAYKDPSYAKLDSFIYINRLLKTSDTNVHLIIRIYNKIISKDYDLSTAYFNLKIEDCISEARVVVPQGGEFDENWVMNYERSFLLPGRLTGVFLAEKGDREVR